MAPNPKRTKGINIRLTEAEYENLKLIRKIHKVSASKLIRQSILFYSANYQTPAKGGTSRDNTPSI